MIKRVFFTSWLALIALACMNGQPQGGGRPSPEEFAKRQTERLTKELSLSADQEKKVLTVYQEMSKKMEASRKEGQQNREAMREQFNTLRKETDAKINEILTKEQQVKYIEFQKKMEQERAQRRQERGDRPPINE